MLLQNIECPNCRTYHDPALEECPTCHKENELYVLNRLPKRVLFLNPIAQFSLFIAGFAFAGMLLTELLVDIFLVQLFAVDSALFGAASLFAKYIVMFIGLLLIVMLTRRQLFFDKLKNPTDYLYGVLYAISLFVVSLLISMFINVFTEVNDNTNQSNALNVVKNYPIIAGSIICFIGPVCEELTYRVGLYSFLRRINKYAAFAVTTIVFALIHFDFYAEDMFTELLSLPSYIACGFLLTLAYEHKGPACSILAHMVYNTYAFVMMVIK